MITTMQIAVSSLVLLFGHCLVWRRRENIIGYVQLATWTTTIGLPLFAARSPDDFEQGLVERYADIMMLGAVAYAFGILVGAALGQRMKLPGRFTFGRRARDRALLQVRRRARWLGVGGLVALVGAFALMGYAPLLAADRTSAKYGVGVYQAGFARAGPLYLFGLVLGGALVPVLLSSWLARRRPLDLVLVVGLTAALFLSLSRTIAVSGLVLVGAALLVTWQVRVRTVALAVAGAFLAGAALNSLVLEPAPVPTPIVEEMANSAPDIRDSLLFLNGFEADGSQEVGVKTFIAGLGVGSSGYDPRTYSLRVLTGADDVSGLASGGLRLPAPLWGHVMAGRTGIVVVAYLSGMFAAWGMALLARVVGPATDRVGVAHLILAATFYLGTFGVLATLHAPSTSGLVLLVVALGTGLDVKSSLRPRGARAVPSYNRRAPSA